MNNNIRVGNLFGIPFYVNPSWFLILGLVTFSLGESLSAQFPALGGTFPWLLGLVSALLMFSSVLAHELGHSLVAIKQGIEVKSISLFLFGGLASLEKESKTPAEAFWVAIAGPLVSLALFGTLTFISQTITLPGPLGAIAGLLAYINLVLALFNLIPGLPLDGGNILKALVWKITGNPYKGVVFASRVGQVVGWIGIIVGALSILGLSNVGSFWTLLIGWFLLQNAGRSAQSATIQDALDGLTAADAIAPDSPIVSANLSLREFANNFVIGNGKWSRFLVREESGKFIGTVSVEDLKTIPTSDWPETPVERLTKPVELAITIRPEQSLLEAIALLEQKQLSQIPVIRDNGEVVGLLERSEIARLLQERAQVKPA